MEKTTFFIRFFSVEKKLVSVPITLSLFVALSSMGEAMAAPEIGHSFSVTASQAVRVTGAVFDASGSPLIGVSVLEKEPPTVRLPTWMATLYWMYRLLNRYWYFRISDM